MKKDRTQDVILGALQAQVISHLALTIGTMYGVNKAVFGGLVSNGTEIETAAILAVVAAVPAGIAVDGALKKWLPYTIAWITGKKDVDTGVERKTWLNWIILSLCIAQLGVSTFLNFSVSPEIVEDAAGDVNTGQYDRMADRATNRYTSDLVRIEESIASAQSEVSKEAESKATLIADARKSKGSEMARLAASGNSWAQGQISSAVRSAERKGDRAINAAKDRLKKEQGRLSSYMDKSGSVLDSVTITATALTAETKTKHEAKKNRWTSVMIWFMALMSFTFVLTTVVVVVLEEETNSDFDSIPTASNIASGVFKKAKNGVTKAMVKVFGLDKFTAAPTLAGIGPIPISVPTQDYTAQKHRNTETQHRTQKSSTETQDCSTGKCPPKHKKTQNLTEKQDGKTQELTEITYTEPIVLTAQNEEGGEWPTPHDKENWHKLVKKARGWAKESVVNENDKTRERNARRWDVFEKYADTYSYRTGVSKEGRAFCTLDPEPVWSEDGQSVYFGNASDGDFDVNNSEY